MPLRLKIIPYGCKDPGQDFLKFTLFVEEAEESSENIKLIEETLAGISAFDKENSGPEPCDESLFRIHLFVQAVKGCRLPGKLFLDLLGVIHGINTGKNKVISFKNLIISSKNSDVFLAGYFKFILSLAEKVKHFSLGVSFVDSVDLKGVFCQNVADKIFKFMLDSCLQEGNPIDREKKQHVELKALRDKLDLGLFPKLCEEIRNIYRPGVSSVRSVQVSAAPEPEPEPEPEPDFRPGMH